MSQGDAITNLADLIAPMPVEQFRALLAARDMYHATGAVGDRYAGLLDWDELLDGVRGTLPPKDIRLFRNRTKVPRFYLRNAGEERAEVVDRMLAADASVMLNHADRHVPSLERLCAVVAEEVGDHVSAVAIATAGAGGALEIHYDPYDVLVLQVDGSKRWVLYDNPVDNPVHGMPRLPVGAPATPVVEVDLDAGDWLLVPAGQRHRCDTLSARSLHIALLIYPLTAVRAVELMLNDMLASPDDRAPMRFGPDGAAQAEEALKQRLMARVAALSIDDLGRLHRTTSAQRHEP